MIINATFKETGGSFDVQLTRQENIAQSFGVVQRIVTSNYNELTHRPSINGVTVEGAKTAADYNLQNKLEMATEQDIDTIIYGG